MAVLGVGPSRLPDEVLVYRPTRRDIDPETGRAVAETLWGRHEWQPGVCWLWCQQADIEVTWIGSVTSSGLHGDLYACRHCLFHLDQRVWADQHHMDMPQQRAHAPSGQGAPGDGGWPPAAPDRP